MLEILPQDFFTRCCSVQKDSCRGIHFPTVDIHYSATVVIPFAYQCPKSIFVDVRFAKNVRSCFIRIYKLKDNVFVLDLLYAIPYAVLCHCQIHY